MWSNVMDYTSSSKLGTGSVLHDVKIAQSLFMSVVFYPLIININLLKIKLIEIKIYSIFDLPVSVCENKNFQLCFFKLGTPTPVGIQLRQPFSVSD